MRKCRKHWCSRWNTKCRGGRKAFVPDEAFMSCSWCYHPDPQLRDILGQTLGWCEAVHFHVTIPNLATKGSQKPENESFPTDWFIGLQLSLSHISPNLFLDVHCLFSQSKAMRQNTLSKLLNPCIITAVAPAYHLVLENSSQKYLWDSHFHDGSEGLT